MKKTMGVIAVSELGVLWACSGADPAKESSGVSVQPIAVCAVAAEAARREVALLSSPGEVAPSGQPSVRTQACSCADIVTGQAVPCPVTPPMPPPPPPPPECPSVTADATAADPLMAIPLPDHLPVLAFYVDGDACPDPGTQCTPPPNGGTNPVPYLHEWTDETFVGQATTDSAGAPVLALYARPAAGTVTSFASPPVPLVDASNAFADMQHPVAVGDQVLYTVFQVDTRSVTNGCKTNRC